MSFHRFGKSWSIFVGYDHEFDRFRFEVNFGGKSAERGINGLFWYKNHFRYASRTKPRVEFWLLRSDDPTQTEPYPPTQMRRFYADVVNRKPS